MHSRFLRAFAMLLSGLGPATLAGAADSALPIATKIKHGGYDPLLGGFQPLDAKVVGQTIIAAGNILRVPGTDREALGLSINATTGALSQILLKVPPKGADGTANSVGVFGSDCILSGQMDTAFFQSNPIIWGRNGAILQQPTFPNDPVRTQSSAGIAIDQYMTVSK